jgi:hypothetical protein
MTGSSTYSNCLPQRAAEMTDSNHFVSDNTPNSWLCYDFKNMLVRPNHYSIRSSEKLWGADYQMVSWVIETSNDDKEWTEIDRHENDRSLLQATGSFSITKPSKFSRYVRLRQIGITR